MLLGLMVQTLDRCEEDRDAVSKLIIAMKEAGVITPQQFMDVSIAFLSLYLTSKHINSIDISHFKTSFCVRVQI